MKYCQQLHACLDKVKNSYYALLCYALWSSLLCSALLCFPPVCSPLLYSTVLQSTLVYYTIPHYAYALYENLEQSAQEFSSNYSLTYMGKTTQPLVKEHPVCIAKTLKNPSQTTPKNTLKCLQNPPWEPPWNQT